MENKYKKCKGLCGFLYTSIIREINRGNLLNFTYETRTRTKMTSPFISLITSISPRLSSTLLIYTRDTMVNCSFVFRVWSRHVPFINHSNICLMILFHWNSTCCTTSWWSSYAAWSMDSHISDCYLIFINAIFPSISMGVLLESQINIVMQNSAMRESISHMYREVDYKVILLLF